MNQQYKQIEKIRESGSALISRAERESDLLPVLLKASKPASSGQAAEIIRHEGEILGSLSAKNIVKLLDFDDSGSSCVLVLEDFGGMLFSKYLSRNLLGTEEFLELAIQAARALESVHSAKIIHKNINPGSFYYNPDSGELKLENFEAATLVPKEKQVFDHAGCLTGSLPYISPEQTGRMNRSIDYRTDFYSLGVMFYEMLTGKLPFSSKDPLELVHAHLAQIPVAPQKINPAIPDMLSRIIMKLMSKTAEERYQSAIGISRDLEHCLSEWKTKGAIEEFSLGVADFSAKLRIPQELYGRDDEVALLLSIFDVVADGSTVLLLVSGYSGVGKSSLVHEMYRPITEKKGFFIEGKFEQYRRDIPFFAWVQALDGFAQYLLKCPEIELLQWRELFQIALTSNGKLITDLVPNLELIMGPQPEVPVLSGQEATNRFKYVFQQFINVIARKDHPLVIFLDDLQWIDGASLDLLKSLMADASLTHLLLIGAYRDNEVTIGHPLIAAVTDLEKKQAKIRSVKLQNLTWNDVEKLVADALRCSLSDSQQLARIIYSKTAGNAFFIHQILYLLEEGNYLDFDPLNCVWQLNIEKINTLEVTDNVVDILVKKIQRLPGNILQLLKFAACIGNRFDLSTLCNITSQPEAMVRHALRDAMSDGWLSEQSGSYSFTHDRIQQAFYSLIPEPDKQNYHFQIVQILLIDVDQIEGNIFDAVNHLSHCLSLISRTEERYRFAKLSRIAGEKANRTAAYEASLKYYLQGISLLPDRHWKEFHEESLTLFLGAAEAAFLVGHFDKMDELCKAILVESHKEMDQLKVYEILVSGTLAQTRLTDAVEIGFKALSILGVNFPAKVEESDWREWRRRVDECLGAKEIQALIEEPTMVCEKAIMKLRILSRLLPAVYKFCPEYLPLITAEMAITSIDNGNIPLSAFGFSCHGMILVGFFGDYQRAWEYAVLSQKIIDKYQAKNVVPRAYQIIEATIRHWMEHASGTIAPLELGYHHGLETGDLEYATYCAEFEANHRFLLGNPLQNLRPKMDAYALAIDKIGQLVALNHHRPVQQSVHNLLGLTDDPVLLKGLAFDETTELESLRNYNDRLCLLIVFFQKIMLATLFRKRLQAGLMAVEGARYADGAPGCFVFPFFLAYELLAFIGAMREDRAFADDQIQNLIAVFYKQLESAAQQAPINYQHLLDLVAAEMAALDDQDAKAEALYESAIQGANHGHYIREEGLAYELAAEFYYGRKMVRFGDLYMANAHACYAKWQAWAKTQDLAGRYPYLVKSTTGAAEGLHPVSTLDLSTILKASQAIYSEIEPDKFLKIMMEIIIQNSGAQKGYLIVNNGADWLVEAERDIDSSDLAARQPVNMDANGKVPASIIRYVARTQKSVILSDAVNEGEFTNDPVIRKKQPKSILCTPFINQGKINAILYLENNLLINAFSPDRVQLLDILCSQAAIALDNSRLYNEMEQRVAQRTRLLALAKEEADQATHLAQTRSSELRRQATFIQAILENIADGIVACDKDGVLTLFNRATREMHGVEQQNLPPEQWADCYDLYLADGETRMKTAEIPLYRAFQGERLRDIEMVIAPKNAERRIVLASGQPMVDDEGNKIGAVASMHEITEQKHIQEQLKAAKDAAEKANRAKAVFLANMSHELRTPMNAILGFAQLMRHDPALSEAQLKNLDIINNSGRHLLELINDILQISKIEAGRISLKATTFDLHGLLEDIEKMFWVQTQARGLTISTIHDNTVPRYVKADQDKLRQILINLIGNAVKFTRKGGIVIRATAQIPASGISQLIVEIEDTGIGISELEIEELFKPFTQSKSVGVSEEGTGLGLAISKNFARLMGGDITVNSRLGEGSVFRLTLEFETADTAADTASSDNRRVTGIKYDKKHWLILVVDDKPDNRNLLCQTLQLIGFQVIEAKNGMEAVEIYEKQLPDLILMDMYMPVMNGFDATRKIKATEAGRNTPVIAVSASVFEEEKPAISESGCDDFIAKPIEIEKLFAVIGRHIPVEYEYQEVLSGAQISIVDTAGIKDKLSRLATFLPEKCKELYDALILLDVSRINAVIREIGAHDPELEAEMIAMADSYDYNRLRDLLETCIETKDRQANDQL